MHALRPARALSSATTFPQAAFLLTTALCLFAATPIRAQSPPPPPNMRLPHNLAIGNGQQPPPPPQSTIPPTLPTAMPTPQPAPIAATLSGPASSKPRRATVDYIGGQLDVHANDSSLNQILRAISRETGMTITGGVADQRVFGTYGPASPSTVLATLLDGTGTNMLLREGDATTPPELVLTPRGGGASPPSPTALPDDSIADEATPARPTPQPTPVATTPAPAQPAPVQVLPVAINPALPVGNPIPPNNVNGSQYNTTPTASQIPTVQSVPIDAIAAPTTTPSVSGIVDSPNPPAGATPAPGTAPAAPTGPLTPEQVFQQLLQMQQKQAQPQPASPPASTTPPQ